MIRNLKDDIEGYQLKIFEMAVDQFSGAHLELAQSGEDDPDIQAETYRYIAVPGQALAYKLGQLKFLELRQRAKDQLGAKFDIRAFHDEMLNGGSMPLDVLDARTNRWIAAVKAGSIANANAN